MKLEKACRYEECRTRCTGLSSCLDQVRSPHVALPDMHTHGGAA